MRIYSPLPPPGSNFFCPVSIGFVCGPNYRDTRVCITGRVNRWRYSLHQPHPIGVTASDTLPIKVGWSTTIPSTYLDGDEDPPWSKEVFGMRPIRCVLLATVTSSVRVQWRVHVPVCKHVITLLHIPKCAPSRLCVVAALSWMTFCDMLCEYDSLCELAKTTVPEIPV